MKSQDFKKCFLKSHSVHVPLVIDFRYLRTHYFHVVTLYDNFSAENWMREFETWCPEVNLLVYYGSMEDRRQSRMSLLYDSKSEYNVVLTT